MDVAHIPMSLRQDPSLGYYSYFVIADTIASATEGNYQPNFDKSSFSKTANPESMLGNVSSLLGRDISPNTPSYSNEVKILNLLEESGALQTTTEQVTSCFYKNPECGMTEFKTSTEQDMSYVANKHHMSKNMCCSVCGTKLESKYIPTLSLSIPSIEGANDYISTAYLAKNLQELNKKLAGSKLLISKQRATAMSWNGFNIDNDFSNYIDLSVAKDKSVKGHLLYLASQNTSQALFVMLAISKIMDQEAQTNSQISAVPKLNFVDQNGNITNISIQSLQERGISKSAIKFVLIQSLGSNRHHLTLPSREFMMVHNKLTQKSTIQNINSNLSKLDDVEPSNETELPNRQIINQVFKELSSSKNDLKYCKTQNLACKIIQFLVEKV